MYFLVLMILVAQSHATVLCPYFCNCDIWEALRRVICSNRRLANIVDGLPNEVQVLDLSYNYLTQLKSHDFDQLTRLKYLNISFNKINSIEMYAFEGLNELNVLDLSYNYLQNILPLTFEDVAALKLLILSGNRIGTFGKPPALSIPSLQALEVKECQFNFMDEKTFSLLPNLTDLDVSGNQFAQLKLEALSPLIRLSTLNLSRNPWLCNSQTLAALTYLEESNVKFTKICKTEMKTERKPAKPQINSNTPQRFGKMILLESNEDSSSHEDGGGDDETKEQRSSKGTDRDISHIWFVDPQVPCVISPPDVAFTEGPEEEIGRLEKFMLQVPSHWAFLVGLQTGALIAIFGMWIWLRCSCSRKSAEVPQDRPLRRSHSLRRSRRLRSDGSQYTELETIDCPGTPPPPYRDIFVT